MALGLAVLEPVLVERAAAERAAAERGLSVGHFGRGPRSTPPLQGMALATPAACPT